MIESSAQYHLLKEVPGFGVKNPLGIIIIHDLKDKKSEAYTAYFYLPSVTNETPFCIKAISASEAEAHQGLARRIADYYSELKQKSTLSRDETLQKSYLDSIFD